MRVQHQKTVDFFSPVRWATFAVARPFRSFFPFSVIISLKERKRQEMITQMRIIDRIFLSKKTRKCSCVQCSILFGKIILIFEKLSKICSNAPSLTNARGNGRNDLIRIFRILFTIFPFIRIP